MTSGDLKVVAVVTVFRPESAPDLLLPLSRQVDAIVVVDDGSGPEYTAVRDLIRATGIEVVEIESNAGIAVALNSGIARARELGADAVVTFDQDSTVEYGFVDALLDAQSRARALGIPAGLVVPEFFGTVSQAGKEVAPGVTMAAHAIQSGMLISIDLLNAVGDMDADLFIDLVDTDFELRCDDAGLPCIVAEGLRLPHRLGARYRFPRPWGQTLPVLMLSTPFRYYYRARNRVIVNRRHRAHASRLRAEGLADSVYFVLAILLARPRSAMLRLIREGFRAGRAGVGGRMPEDLGALASTISWRAERVED